MFLCIQERITQIRAEREVADARQRVWHSQKKNRSPNSASRIFKLFLGEMHKHSIQLFKSGSTRLDLSFKLVFELVRPLNSKLFLKISYFKKIGPGGSLGYKLPDPKTGNYNRGASLTI